MFKQILFIVLVGSTLYGCSLPHISANTLLVADWGQTRYISDNTASYHENNRLLGEYPTTGEVNRYFASSLIVYNAVYYTLPDKYKEKWATTVALVQLSVTTHNLNLGIGVKF